MSIRSLTIVHRQRIAVTANPIHHTAYQIRSSPQKVLVAIRTDIGIHGHAFEIPPLQPPRKGRKLCIIEVLGEDLGHEAWLVVDDKSFAVGKPRQDALVGRRGENIVESLGEA